MPQYKQVHEMAIQCVMIKKGDIDDDMQIKVWKESLFGGSAVFSVTVEDMHNFMEFDCGESAYLAEKIYRSLVDLPGQVAKREEELIELRDKHEKS